MNTHTDSRRLLERFRSSEESETRSKDGGIKFEQLRRSPSRSPFISDAYFAGARVAFLRIRRLRFERPTGRSGNLRNVELEGHSQSPPDRDSSLASDE